MKTCTNTQSAYPSMPSYKMMWQEAQAEAAYLGSPKVIYEEARMMSGTDHAALVRTLYKRFNLNQLDGTLTPMIDNFKLVVVPLHRTFWGLTGFTQFFNQLRAWSDNLTIHIAHQFVAHDEVFNMLTLRRTHPGPRTTGRHQAPPTGWNIEYSVPEVWSFKDDNVVCIHTYLELPDFMN